MSESGLKKADRLRRRLRWYRSRLEEIDKHKGRFREPEKTMICDILANGKLLPDKDGKRYGKKLVP